MRISPRCPCLLNTGILAFFNNGQGRLLLGGILILSGLFLIITVTVLETRSLHQQKHALRLHPHADRKFSVAVTTDVEDSALHFGVVIDCGSSGSRIYVYFWHPHNGNPHELLDIQVVIDKNMKPVVKKIEPGISAYADSPAEASEYLRPLLVFAAENIPRSKHKETPLYIMATAGMRMLSRSQQRAILDDLRVDIPLDFDFLFTENHAEVISGKQEGIYAWIAVNYVLGKFDHDVEEESMTVVQVPGVEQELHVRKRTIGILDMGGGSAQIAYEVPKSVRFNSPKEEIAKSLLAEFNLGCTESDLDHTYRVYVATFLGFGGNVARTRYERMLIGLASRNNSVASVSSPKLGILDTNPIYDPCLPVDMLDQIEVNGITYFLRGSGNLTECQERVRPILNNTVHCMKEPCSINGVFQPEIDFENSEFYGFSEFYYTMEDVLRISGRYDHQKFQSAAKEYCHTKWSTLVDWFGQRLYPKADENRLKYQCYKSAWMTAVLHEGFRFPRSYKQLTTAQLVDGRDMHWTLGALLYKTRFYPLSDIQKQKSHHSRSSWFIPPLHHTTHLLILCFVIVVAAIFIYLRRLRIVKPSQLRKIPSMAYLLTEEGQVEDGIMIRMYS